MDIDTTACSFNSTPLYFTSMSGIDTQLSLAGYTAIYLTARTSFRVYIRSVDTSNNIEMLNASSVYRWNVNWCGITY